MLILKNKYLLTGEELSSEEILQLITYAEELKKARQHNKPTLFFPNKQLAMIFEKPSLRTKFSFTVAMRELGGDIIESVADTRKHEEPEDLIRVLEGYCHAVMVRTHEDTTLTRMHQASSIPLINGLSNNHHPCQILADFMTIKEVFGKLEGLTLTYIGDGNNILHSLILMAPLVKMNIHYCCPTDRGPNAELLKRSMIKAAEHKTTIKSFISPEEAVLESHAVYTDVWTSMGFENRVDESIFEGYQVNEKLLSKALPGAIFLHCLPMVRGKEVSETLPDAPCSAIFKQSENRMHVQKALLVGFL